MGDMDFLDLRPGNDQTPNSPKRDIFIISKFIYVSIY